MNTYKRHRFPPDFFSYAVWLFYRFNQSNRDIEDLLAERGIIVSRKAIRLWSIKCGAKYARRLKRKRQCYGDTFYIDEVFVKINGKQLYLWRAVDQESLPREALWVWGCGGCLSSGQAGGGAGRPRDSGFSAGGLLQLPAFA